MRPYGWSNLRVPSLSWGQHTSRSERGRRRRWPIAPEPTRPAKSAHADPRRNLPAIGALSSLPRARRLIERHGQAAVIASLRDVLAELRRTAGQEGLEDPAEGVLNIVEARLGVTMSPTLLQALNATGIVIHTNLGRAPLADEAQEAIKIAAAGYSNLEIDLETGKRSSRQLHVEKLLTDITGAQAALAVNNCAGAVLVTLAALGAGGGIIASRGELVEIGGEFRIPDVVRQTGGRLVEVGTTNRTRVKDYEQAIDETTRVLLRTHPSNYRIVGFTEAPPLPDLAQLARSRGLALVEDLGGGALIDLSMHGIAGEPTVQASVAGGADIVLFSGDKLLGGPQAGLIVGREDLIQRIRSHPLARALRIDKLSLAALAATLRLYLGAEPREKIPVLRMLTQPPQAIAARAQRLLEALGAFEQVAIKLDASVGYAGGGAMPMQALPTSVVRIASERLSVDELARRLRMGRPCVLARIESDALVLDARTLADSEVSIVAQVVRSALQR